MKVKSIHLAIIVLVMVFGSVALTSALGLWRTTNEKTPAAFKTGEFAGQYDPADIRGSYTLDDIFNAFEIPLADLGVAFGVEDPADYASFQVKELETIYAGLADQGKEIGTNSVRYFVALYKGLPYETTNNIYLPKAAVEILKAKAPLTDEQKEALDKISVELTTETDTSTVVATNTIKGSTTFGELLSWGVSQEAVEQVLQEEVPAQETLIKDYASAKGIEFSILKEQLQSLVE